MDEHLRAAALDYHRAAPAGKIAVVPTKSLVNQHDLSLAYSPGVAAACEAIVDDPAQASEMTSRVNLVAVVTNGTAVLGLGNIGPLASKPVMEGKGCLERLTKLSEAVLARRRVAGSTRSTTRRGNDARRGLLAALIQEVRRHRRIRRQDRRA